MNQDNHQAKPDNQVNAQSNDQVNAQKTAMTESDFNNAYKNLGLSFGAQLIGWLLTMVTLVCAFTFATKLMNFTLTIWRGGPSMLGFAIVPVTLYLSVAGGFLLLLIWAFMKGQFSDIERAKFELLEDDARYTAMEAEWRRIERNR